jgi:hypothetical protein
VVVVIGANNMAVQGGFQPIDETFEKLTEEIGIQVADGEIAEFDVPCKIAASAQVNGHRYQGSIHGVTEAAGSFDAGQPAESLEDGFAQYNTSVFNEVMGIHFNVAGGIDDQAHLGMAGQGFEHMA